jgi:hypothetical protein
MKACQSIFQFIIGFLKGIEGEYNNLEEARPFASFELRRYLIKLSRNCPLISIL